MDRRESWENFKHWFLWPRRHICLGKMFCPCFHGDYRHFEDGHWEFVTCGEYKLIGRGETPDKAFREWSAQWHSALSKILRKKSGEL